MLAAASRRAWGTVVATLCVAVFTFRYVDELAGAGHDDTFITLLAAERLAAGDGFVTPNGEPGEIGSSVLHVCLLAGLRLLGAADLFLTNKVMGLLLGAGALSCVFAFRKRLLGSTSDPTFPALLAVTMAGALPSFGYWTMGGLETPLVSVLLVCLAAALEGSAGAVVGTLACLLVASRPEGFVFLAAVAASGLLHRRPRRWWVSAFVVPLSFFVALSLTRLVAFGAAMPVPVLAKTGGRDVVRRVVDGLHYVTAFGRASWLGAALLLAILARASLVAIQPRRYLAAQPTGPALVAGTQLSFAAVAGGDWMFHYRFVAPAVPLLAVVAVRTLVEPVSRTLRDRVRARLRPVVSAAAFVYVFGLSHVLGALERGDLCPPYLPAVQLQKGWEDLFDDELGGSLGERARRLNAPYRRDETQLRPFLDDQLRRLIAQTPDIPIATHQMGFLPYELRRLGITQVRFVDTVAITDPRLARLPGAREPRGLVDGLDPERFLDPRSDTPLAAAVRARRPDLVYVLEASPSTVSRLSEWGWTLVWDAPAAKIFARVGADS